MFYAGAVRWENLLLTTGADDRLPAPLFRQGAIARTFRTPEFRGVTFYEVRARSIINRVPEASRLPFRWTINPYRGCTHGCVYCFARQTHTYLDLDAGRDFETKVVVKVNAAEALRRELAAPTWRGEPIAMGTNVDPYQRAEGRYRLMPGILEALRDAANPFSILTKGSLILRDAPLLLECAEVADVVANVSVGFTDPALWRSLEPGTPSPARRLAVCAELNRAGIRCGVLMAPIIPFLTDGPAQLSRTVRAIAEAGAVDVTPIVLHLRPGAREWFMAWLARERPDLVSGYRRLYARGSYAPAAYRREVEGRVHELALRFGIARPAGRGGRGAAAGNARPRPVEQLALL